MHKWIIDKSKWTSDKQKLFLDMYLDISKTQSSNQNAWLWLIEYGNLEGYTQIKSYMLGWKKSIRS